MRMRKAGTILPPLAAAAATAVAIASAPSDAEPNEFADGFEWVLVVAGPESGEAGDDLVIDDDGSLFIAGHHGGIDVDLDGTIDLPAGSIDPLFIKMKPDGGVDWIRTPTGPEYDGFTRIALDRTGGAYVVGSFRENLTFGSGASLRGDGETDGYLARYDAAGDLVWSRAIHGASFDAFRDVASDAAGNAYVAGWSRGRFTIDGDGQPYTPSGEFASVIASYDPAGTIRWVRTGTAPALWSVSRIEVGPAGDLYVAGTYRGQDIDLDGDDRPDLAARLGSPGFVARYSADGDYLGAWTVGGNVMEIAFAGDGDVVLAGMLGEGGTFEGASAADVAVRSGGDGSAFLARYSPDGVLRWARSYAMDGAWDVATDGDRFVLSGFYRKPVDIDEDGSIEAHDPDPNRDADLSILVVAGDGRPLQVWTAPGPGHDQARAAAFLPGQPVLYVVGFVQLTADFTGNGEFEEGWIRCDALGDLFIARYRTDDAECRITLEGEPRREGDRKLSQLTWSGATGAQVEIHRDGRLIATTANDGAYTDSIAPNIPGPFRYQVFEAGSRTCSANVTIDY